MHPSQKAEYLLYGFSIISLFAGTVVLLKYGLPKVRNADDLPSLLSPWEWTPEKFERYKKHDFISRVGITLLLSGVFWLLAVTGIHILISYWGYT